MGLEIFKLYGSIMVDSSKAEKSIHKTDSKAQKLAKSLGKGIKKAAKFGAGMVAGAGAAVGALAKVTSNAAETTDRIDKMSQKIGISRKSFQELDFICSQSGTSIDVLQTGVKTLTDKMQQASEGSSTAKTAFEQLGVSWEDGNGKLKSQEQMLFEAMSALQGMEDQTQKSALAVDLFGKAGTELMPLLNGASGSIEEMKNKANELGLVMSDEAIDSGVKFTDTVDQVKRSLGSVISKIGVHLMPIIQNLLAWVLANMPQIQSTVKKVFNVISIVAKYAIDGIKLIIEWFKKIRDSANTEGTTINAIWTGLKESLKILIETVKAIIKNFIDICKVIWEKWGDTIKHIFSNIFKRIKVIIDTALKVIRDIFNIFGALFRGDWEGVWNGIKQLFKDIWDGIKEWFKIALDSFLLIFTEIIPKILQIGKNIFNGLWDGIKSVWKNMCNWVSSKVNWLKNKLCFWRKGKKKLDESPNSATDNVNGSHAAGLSYVPFNGYRAELHKGEEVVNAQDKQSLLTILKALLTNGSANGEKVEITINLDGEILARKLYDPFEKEKNLRGSNFAMGGAI